MNYDAVIQMEVIGHRMVGLVLRLTATIHILIIVIVNGLIAHQSAWDLPDCCFMRFLVYTAQHLKTKKDMIVKTYLSGIMLEWTMMGILQSSSAEMETYSPWRNVILEADVKSNGGAGLLDTKNIQIILTFIFMLRKMFMTR